MSWLDQKILAMDIAQVELEEQGYDPKKARKALQVWHQSDTALIEWIKKNALAPYEWAYSEYWFEVKDILDPQSKWSREGSPGGRLLPAWVESMKRTKIPIRNFIQTSMFMGVVPRIPPHKVSRHNRK